QWCSSDKSLRERACYCRIFGERPHKRPRSAFRERHCHPSPSAHRIQSLRAVRDSIAPAGETALSSLRFTPSPALEFGLLLEPPVPNALFAQSTVFALSASGGNTSLF